MKIIEKIHFKIINELKEFVKFHSIVYSDDFEAIKLREESSQDFLQQNMVLRSKYLKYSSLSLQSFYRKLFSEHENSTFLFLQLIIFLLINGNSQYALLLSGVSYKLFNYFYLVKFLLSIFQVLEKRENREVFFHNLKTLFWNFMKKILMLKIIHVFFSKIVKFLPPENQNYFIDNLNKVETNTPPKGPNNSKNYFYIVLAISLSVSAFTLLYKNRRKIKGFLLKTEKKITLIIPSSDTKTSEKSEKEKGYAETILEYLYYIYKEFVPDDAKYGILLMISKMDEYYKYYCPKVLQDLISSISSYVSPAITFLKATVFYNVCKAGAFVMRYISAIITNHPELEPFVGWIREVLYDTIYDMFSVLLAPFTFIGNIVRHPLLALEGLLRYFRGDRDRRFVPRDRRRTFWQ
jgi:hypothetical protein